MNNMRPDAAALAQNDKVPMPSSLCIIDPNYGEYFSCLFTERDPAHAISSLCFQLRLIAVVIVECAYNNKTLKTSDASKFLNVCTV